MDGHDFRKALGGNPAHRPRQRNARGTSRASELGEELARHRVRFRARQVSRADKSVVELVGVPWIRPFLLAHPRDGRGIQRPQILGRRGLAGAARVDGLCPPLLERRIVKERVRPGVQDLV